MYEEFTQERIMKLRVEHGATARDMSLSLGQNESYINQIENKKTLPSLRGLFYICEYFRITPQEFFDEGNTYPEKIQELVAEAQKMNADSLSHIIAIMKEMNRRK